MKFAMLFVSTVLALGATTAIAQSATVSDPVGDFLPSYTGPHDADLDVTSFSVDLNNTGSDFLIAATFAGAINQAGTDPYVIGVDTGTGHIAPFASIGNAGVVFDQAIVVDQNGSANLGSKSLPSSDVTISGDKLSLDVPVSLFPSTGFSAANYGFNIWPRDGLSNNDQIADFAPNNALLSVSPGAVSAAPEPGTWMLMLVGIGTLGLVLRRRNHGYALIS